jgi:hypothetical protein
MGVAPQAADGQGQPVLVVDHAGMSAWFDDPKDRAFGEALLLLPTRIRELPGEIDDIPPEVAGLMAMGFDAVTSPSRFSLTYDAQNAQGAGFGVGVVLSLLTGDRAQATSLTGAVGTMLRMSDAPFEPAPSERWEGMNELQTPVGPVAYGARQAGDGWLFELLAGAVDDPDAAFAALPKAPGADFKPIVRCRFDASAIDEGIDAWRGMMGPDEAQGFDMMAGYLEKYGLAGDAPISVDCVFGRTSNDMVAHTVVHDAANYRESWHMSDTTLASADFLAIPSDASVAWLAKSSWEWVAQTVEEVEQFNPRVREPLDMFEDMTGVNVLDDVVGSLGDTMAVYISDATGGGGLFSGVLLVSVKDKETLSGALSSLTGQANEMADQSPLGPGHIRFTLWRHDELSLTSLRFPGLPVPLEVTFAMAGDWLVLSASPQGAIAAARQAMGKGDKGLWGNESFAGTVSRDRAYVSVAFADAERNARMGYWLTSMIGSGLANAVRSPSDPAREPGLLVPPFHELMDGATSQVEVTYWDGDALVTDSHSDHSLLAGATVSLGSLGHLAPIMIVPALGQGMRQWGALDQADDLHEAIAAKLWQTFPFTMEQRAVIGALAANPSLLDELEAGIR